MDPKIIAVLIGVIGAFSGIYLKEYIQYKIQKEKAIIILGANLFLFMEKVQSNEHLSKFLMAASILDDRYIKSLKSGDDTKYKELLSAIESIVEHAETEDLLTNNHVHELCKTIKSFSKKEIEIIYEEIDRIREDIEHGTYILGRSDINILDKRMVYRVLQVKRSTSDIFIALKILLTGIYERENIDYKYVKLQILGIVKDATLACRHVMPLLKICNEKN